MGPKRKRSNSIAEWSDQHKDEFLETSYLELGDTYHIHTESPFKPRYNKDQIPAEIVKLCCNSNYLHLPAKWLFNVDLFTYQLVALQTLWTKRFPILLASRGGAKTMSLGLYAMMRAVLDQGVKIVVAGAGLRQSGIVFEKMNEIWDNAPVLRDICGGSDNRPKRGMLGYEWNVGKSSVIGIPIGCCAPSTLVTTNDGVRTMGEVIDDTAYKALISHDNLQIIDGRVTNPTAPIKHITTARGYTFSGTFDHRLRVFDQDTMKIVWKRLDNLKLNDHILINRQERWWDSSFECDKDEAYALGAMIGDGSWSGNPYTFKFSTADPEFIPHLNKGLHIEFKKKKSESYSYLAHSKKIKSAWLSFWGLDPEAKSSKKVLPNNLMSASQSCVAACLQGLFDTDGHVFVAKDKRGGITCGVGFTNTSKILVQQIQYLLLHFGIVSTVQSRPGRKSPSSRNMGLEINELRISGKDVQYFANKIGFRLKRKQDKLLQTLVKKIRIHSTGDLVPIRKDFLLDFARKNNAPLKEINSRKAFTRNFLTSLLRDWESRGLDRFVIDELKSLSSPDYYYDVVTSVEDGEGVTVDVCIPNGNEYCGNGFYSHNSGQKIRGLRANIIIVDEFSAVNPDIFETVLRGFAAVHSQDTVEKVKLEYQKQALDSIGLGGIIEDFLSKEATPFGLSGNQIILSGTAYFQFNHFYKYFKRYCDIILNEGVLSTPEGVSVVKDWDEYAVIRVPHDHLPPGLMDQSVLEQGRAIMDNAIFQAEYGCIFPKDSNGFYPASVIEGSTCPLWWQDKEISFYPEVFGDPAAKYCMGIDPASERDNLTISITRLFDGYAGHVYTWSTNRKRFEEDRKNNRPLYEGIKDYNTFIIRKIHDLIGRFNIVRIHIDSGGGGRSIVEGLKDPSKVRDGEPLIYDMEDEEVGGEKGLHILKLCIFSRRDWYETAHYNLLKDLTARNYIFPAYDAVGIEQFRLHASDLANSLMIDNTETNAFEIQELKYQTTLIEETTTYKGLKKFDLPKLAGIVTEDIQNKLKKDHFTSLLLCCDAVREYLVNSGVRTPTPGGYSIADISTTTVTNKARLYYGPGLGGINADNNMSRNVRFDDTNRGGTVAY